MVADQRRRDRRSQSRRPLGQDEPAEAMGSVDWRWRWRRAGRRAEVAVPQRDPSELTLLSFDLGTYTDSKHRTRGLSSNTHSGSPASSADSDSATRRPICRFPRSSRATNRATMARWMSAGLRRGRRASAALPSPDSTWCWQTGPETGSDDVALDATSDSSNVIQPATRGVSLAGKSCASFFVPGTVG